MNGHLCDVHPASFATLSGMIVPSLQFACGPHLFQVLPGPRPELVCANSLGTLECWRYNFLSQFFIAPWSVLVPCSSHFASEFGGETVNTCLDRSLCFSKVSSTLLCVSMTSLSFRVEVCALLLVKADVFLSTYIDRHHDAPLPCR